MPLGSGVKNYEARYLGKASPTQKKDRGRLVKKTSRGKPEDLAGSKKLWGVKNNDRKRIFNQ
jgi:hypothetical protein